MVCGFRKFALKCDSLLAGRYLVQPKPMRLVHLRIGSLILPPANVSGWRNMESLPTLCHCRYQTLLGALALGLGTLLARAWRFGGGAI